jgi:hypothetical protein
MKQKFETQGQFQRALAVAKSTMSRYLRRSDWPVRRTAPWNTEDLATVQRWRVGLQENRAAVFDDELIEAPGPLVVSWQDVAGGKPWNARRWMGDVLFDELTIPDFESLAEYTTHVIWWCLGEASRKRDGCDLKPEATPEYYRDLYAWMADNDCESFLNYLNVVTGLWVAQRFIDCPDWWKDLPDPPDEPPSELMEGLLPLRHRRGK